MTSLLKKLSHSFHFSGVASRREFWGLFFFATIVALAIWRLDLHFFGHQAVQFIVTDQDPNDGVHTVTRVPPYDGKVILGKPSVLSLILLSIPVSATARRRLRDAGMTGRSLTRIGLLLLLLIPFFATSAWQGFLGYIGIFVWPLVGLVYGLILLSALLVLAIQLLRPSERKP